MLIDHKQEMIVNILKEGMATPKQIADKLNSNTMTKGYTEFKVQSMILTLARKGLIDKTKAAILLRGTEMVKFLNYKHGSELRNK